MNLIKITQLINRAKVLCYLRGKSKWLQDASQQKNDCIGKLKLRPDLTGFATLVAKEATITAAVKARLAT